MEGGNRPDFFASQNIDANILRTNSAMAAIFFALSTLKEKKIFIPFYCCASVSNAARNAGKNIIYYHLSDDLLPDTNEVLSFESASVRMAGAFADMNEHDRGGTSSENSVEPACPDTILLIINYFGAITKRIHDFVEKYHDRFAAVIIDQSHCFYAKPFLSQKIFNIYSCRKFFGVPDGGFLISTEEVPQNPPLYRVDQNFLYLVRSLENGQQAAYDASKVSNLAVQKNPLGMSLPTRAILGMIDYRYVADKRKANFGYLMRAFEAIGRFDLSEAFEPLYLFPLWITKDIKKELVARKIYVPTLWREAMIPECEGRIEYDLSQNALFLPLDQRYDKRDMDHLIKTVLDVLNESL